MKLIAQVVKGIQVKYPNIKYHFHSGNSNGVTEQLDKELFDFGILIQPADLSKYNYINLPANDVWRVVMKKDSPLTAKETIQTTDLLNVPLPFSRQAMKPGLSRNEFAEWFGDDYDKLNVVSTYCDSNLCFRPLEPRPESTLNIVVIS